MNIVWHFEKGIERNIEPWTHLFINFMEENLLNELEYSVYGFNKVDVKIQRQGTEFHMHKIYETDYNRTFHKESKVYSSEHYSLISELGHKLPKKLEKIVHELRDMMNKEEIERVKFTLPTTKVVEMMFVYKAFHLYYEEWY